LGSIPGVLHTIAQYVHETVNPAQDRGKGGVGLMSWYTISAIVIVVAIIAAIFIGNWLGNRPPRR
jgi:amino acid transporter